MKAPNTPISLLCWQISLNEDTKEVFKFKTRFMLKDVMMWSEEPSAFADEPGEKVSVYFYGTDIPVCILMEFKKFDELMGNYHATMILIDWRKN